MLFALTALAYCVWTVAAATEGSGNGPCECQNFIDVLGMDCKSIEANFDVDCSGCVCDATAGTETPANCSTGGINENDTIFQVRFYVSLGANIVSVLLLFASEFMGANTKTKFNGIIDAFKKLSKAANPQQKKSANNIELSSVVTQSTAT